MLARELSEVMSVLEYTADTARVTKARCQSQCSARETLILLVLTFAQDRSSGRDI